MMIRTTVVNATFEKGVFVPTRKPLLREHAKVRLTVEALRTSGKLAAVAPRRAIRRIKLQPDLARYIALSDEVSAID